jgi:hypothetical protein
MKLRLILLFFLPRIILNAQYNHFNLLVGFGGGYTFNDKTLNHGLNNTVLLGTNYIVTNKAQRIQFNPGIYYQGNHYHAAMKDQRRVHVNQNVFNLTLDMLMKLATQKYLRVGLFFNRLDYSNLFISETELTGRAYYQNNTSEIRKDYDANLIQAGITLGFCYSFMLMKQEQRVNIKVMQIATPVVRSDYSLGTSVAGQDVKVLSLKARPAMLVLTYESSIQRVKKDKLNTVIEEEE